MNKTDTHRSNRLKNKLKNSILNKILKYILKNLSVLLKKSFYKKNNDKIYNYSLIIFDDTFPSVYSPFRYEEYMSYLKNINSVYIFSNGSSLKALNETKNEDELILDFEHEFPKYKGRVFNANDMAKAEKIGNIKNKVAIITFLNNVINNLTILEEFKIPFVFTLYPGGGFSLGDGYSDNKIKTICSSKYFKKVIVTQKITYEYLVKNKLCPCNKIEFIYGVVTPQSILENKIEKKQYYDIEDNNLLNICFVAHKYSEKGLDKGYDLFIDTAKIILKQYNNIKFHIVGEFNENDIDVSDIKNNIIFYGVKKSEWFKDFYQKMDILISPNRPFKLSKGSFDGFPTASATEAMANGVALICTDELKLNIKFKNKKDLIIIKPETKDIVNIIEKLYKNPQIIKNIGKAGKKKIEKYYSAEYQIIPRLKIIKNIAKLYRR